MPQCSHYLTLMGGKDGEESLPRLPLTPGIPVKRPAQADMRHIIGAQLDLEEAPLLVLQVVRSSLLSAGESQSQQISLSKEQRYCKAAEGEGGCVGRRDLYTPNRHTASEFYVTYVNLNI